MNRITETDRAAINAQLSKDRMRLAQFDESGWYVLVALDGAVIKVWATDAK